MSGLLNIGLPIAQTQYRASARVWLPVRDHADFENWKRIGVETRQLVKMEDVAEANDLLCRWLVIASEIAPELTKADLFTKTRELLAKKGRQP